MRGLRAQEPQDRPAPESRQFQPIRVPAAADRRVRAGAAILVARAGVGQQVEPRAIEAQYPIRRKFPDVFGRALSMTRVVAFVPTPAVVQQRELFHHRGIRPRGHAPLPPDRGPDTIAWAQRMDGMLRNGRLLPAVAAERRLDTGAIVFVSHAAAGKPVQNAELVAPGRFVALPSIAYHLARAACGDGVAAVSLNGPCGWDYAGGHPARGVFAVAATQTLRVTTSPLATHAQAARTRRQATTHARATRPTYDNGGQAMAGKALKDVVYAWVAREEIRSVREIDRPDGEYSIAFDYNIGDQTFEVFVDVEEEIGFLSVYVYEPIRALESRVDELLRLFNRKNGHLHVGSLEVVGERRSIRYRASVPPRPDALLPDDIERLVQLGGDLFHDAFPQIMAVLCGGVSAQDASEMGKACGKEQVLNWAWIRDWFSR